MKGYLGIDIGSISTKGVVIDENLNIVAEKYIWTQGDPIAAVRMVVDGMNLCGIEIISAGTTGSARRLAGIMIGSSVIKNEITAHATGTLSCYPQTKTIFEIGGQDSKIIIIDNGVVVDYAMNTLCAAGTGAFLSSQAARLGINIEDFGTLALSSKNPAKIAARCTVFAESDLVHKAQMGYGKPDIAGGLCLAVVQNYLNNLSKGKKIKPPIVFQGGVSKNAGVVRAFRQATGFDIITHEKGHLMGALGAAILAKGSGASRGFDLSLLNKAFATRGSVCNKCENNCELMGVYREGKLIDVFGSRCGEVRAI